MSSIKLTGPRITPKSGSTRRLVVFLHGYGANGDDLIEVGRQWRDFLPDTAFASPHAPEFCSQSPGGRQWFQLTMRDPAERWKGVVAARPALDSFLDEELSRLNLTDRDLALVGFSQGSMMALHVGLRRRNAPAAILAYSGMLVGADKLNEATARDERGAPPPILLVHGDRDDVIPVDAMFEASEALAQAGLGAQWRLAPGLGHGIDRDGLIQGGLFLNRSFSLPFPSIAEPGSTRRI